MNNEQYEFKKSLNLLDELIQAETSEHMKECLQDTFNSLRAEYYHRFIFPKIKWIPFNSEES